MAMTEELTSKSIEERLAHLESQNRRLKSLFAVICACFGLCLVAAAPQAPVVNEDRTHRVVVVDGEGTERVVLGEDKDAANKRDKTFGLSIRDTDGKRRGSLLTRDVGGTANFTLLTGKEVRRLEGWTGRESGGTWLVFDEEGKKMKSIP
jgi:hypothetical protein